MTVEGRAGQSAPNFRWDFFISYTQADRAWAEWIAWELDRAGYRVLVQAWNMLPGVDWRQAMHDGMRLAERTLAVLSKGYLTSVYTEMEWQSAYRADLTGKSRKLVPVRIEDFPPPPPFDKIVAFDLFGLPEDVAREALLTQISGIAAGYIKPRTPPAFPGMSRPWRYQNRRIPDEAHLAMGRLAHRRITSFAFTPSNGWAMVTRDGGHATRGVPVDCFDTLTRTLAAGGQVDCIAFPPSGDGAWLITTDSGLFTHGLPNLCQQRLLIANENKWRVTEVAFTPDGNGWVVIDSEGIATHEVDVECQTAIRDLHKEGRRITRVAFDASGGWVVIADREIRSAWIDTECSEMMADFIEDGWLIQNIAFAPRRNGWSIYACDRAAI